MKKVLGVPTLIIALATGAFGMDLGCSKAGETEGAKIVPPLGVGSTKGIFYKTCNVAADCATFPSGLDSACVGIATDCISHGCYAMLKSGQQCPQDGLVTACVQSNGSSGHATCSGCGWGTCGP